MNKSTFLTLFFIIILSICVMAQPNPNPGGNPNNIPCWPPPCVPIDGGIGIFTFLAILFGYKVLSKNK